MAVGHQEFTQKKPDQLVYLELGLGNGGMLLTVSEEGFRFRAVTPVRANSSMPFAFSLDGRNRLEGEGTVEWIEEDGKCGGMRFTEVSSEFRATLSEWLDADSSHHAGREVIPEASAPDDSMEKIRQELRSGYPQRPAAQTPSEAKQEPAKKAEPTARVPEKKTAPVASASDSEKNVSEKNISENIQSGKNVADKISAAQKPKPPVFTQKTEKVSDSNPPQTSSRFFPSPPLYPPTPEKPAGASSAFLKPPPESKTPVEPGHTPMDVHFVEPPAPAVPPKHYAPYVPASSVLFTKPKRRETRVADEAAAPEETLVPHLSLPEQARTSVPATYSEPARSEPARPYIPPLEDSFEQAWERSKLSSPPDSPHFTRAAAGSIIAIALAVILGALVYNFRQDIGSIFIQLGQSISGEVHPSAPAPAQETKPDATSSDAQSQSPVQQNSGPEAKSTPAESNGAAKAPENSAAADSPEKSPASEATTEPSRNKSRAATTESSGNKKNAAAPPVTKAPVIKPPENPVRGVADDSAAKSGIGTDGGIGQEEFSAAREILGGGHRQRDLSVAVALLWSSVKKGYVPAEVTLADLYRRGDGVEKNCDQARVLLVAASKKGSLDAREMLERIAERGCG